MVAPAAGARLSAVLILGHGRVFKSPQGTPGMEGTPWTTKRAPERRQQNLIFKWKFGRRCEDDTFVEASMTQTHQYSKITINKYLKH